MATDRSERLVILAEVVTRWPALQRFLHRWSGPHTGLQLLAAAAPADHEGRRAARNVFGDHATADDALTTHRQLVCDHDGIAMADLAAQIP